MQLLIPAAQAAEAAPGGGFPIDLLIIVALFAALYFLILRPQQKRAREHRELVSGLSRGDEVVTSGGMLGRIVEVQSDFLLVEVTAGVQIRLQRAAVSAALPKGTLKNLDEPATGGKKGKGRGKRRDREDDEDDEAANRDVQETKDD